MNVADTPPHREGEVTAASSQLPARGRSGGDGAGRCAGQIEGSLAVSTASVPAPGSCHASGQDCTCSTSCVPPVPSARDRQTALQHALAAETEPLVALTHLLRLCRDEHRLLWEHVNDPPSRRRVAATLDPLLAQPPADILQPLVRRLLAAALDPVDDVPVVVTAHALAGFLDERYGHTFTASFRRRSPYQPALGDPVPLDAPDLRTITAMRPTAPPWRLANRLDETRRVRLAGDWALQFQVVFDYTLADTLADLIGPDTVIATGHPNRGLEEFDLTGTVDGRTFPVRPADPVRQCATIYSLLGAAAEAGASIVVLPELCVTETLAADLHAWVHRPGRLRLLVAGSYHHQESHRPGSPARRRNSAICWVRGHDEPLIQDKHSPADRPINEGIQPQGWPPLRIYVTSDGWHLAIAICRDLLNPQAVNALAEAGANLILVPAMSETLVPFGGPGAHLVGSRQAIVVVANNPADWSDTTPTGARPSRALFGHPGFGQQTRYVNPPDPAAGLALLTVGSAQLVWQPVHPSRATEVVDNPDPRQGERPAWLHTIAAATVDPAAVPHRPVPLRTAAVLVLLSDAASGPQVLLTERASDLTDYPGLLSFPGGRTEPHDAGPVDTALREAAEEVGVQPHTVEILGLLLPLALPDTGYLVTPVVGWTARPADTAAVNLAEVTAAHQIPLAALRACPRTTTLHVTFVPEPAALGPMTAAVIDQLLGALAHTDHPNTSSPTGETNPPGRTAALGLQHVGGDNACSSAPEAR